MIINSLLTLDDIATEKRKIGGAVRLRVESAGTWEDTRLLAVEEDGTTHEVRLVQRIDIALATGECARATISEAVMSKSTRWIEVTQ